MTDPQALSLVVAGALSVLVARKLPNRAVRNEDLLLLPQRWTMCCLKTPGVGLRCHQFVLVKMQLTNKKRC